MATDAEAGTQIDAADVWRAIGRLEGAIASLKDCQEETNRRLDAGFLELNRRLNTGFLDTNRRLETGFLEINRRLETGFLDTNRRMETGFLEINRRLEGINRRLDRVTYTVLAGGSVLLVAIFAVRFVGS